MSSILRMILYYLTDCIIPEAFPGKISVYFPQFVPFRSLWIDPFFTKNFLYGFLFFLL